MTPTLKLTKKRKSAFNRLVVSTAVESGNLRPRSQLKTGVGVWEWNLRTNKVAWNAELAAIFGLEPDGVKSYADFCARVHPADCAISHDSLDLQDAKALLDQLDH